MSISIDPAKLPDELVKTLHKAMEQEYKDAKARYEMIRDYQALVTAELKRR